MVSRLIVERRSRGFTLVEILIVLAILSILASFAYSSYRGSVEKSRRVDAQGVLQGLAQAMERYQTTNGTYAGTADGSKVPTMFSGKSPIEGNQTFYNIRIPVATTTSYILAAEPVGAQSGNGALFLTSTGRLGWDVDNSNGGDIDGYSSLGSGENCWKC